MAEITEPMIEAGTVELAKWFEMDPDKLDDLVALSVFKVMLASSPTAADIDKDAEIARLNEALEKIIAADQHTGSRADINFDLDGPCAKIARNARYQGKD